MNLPNDPAILLSFVNMKLRDFYPDLDAMCDDLDADRAEIESALKRIGYVYKEERNQFV